MLRCQAEDAEPALLDPQGYDAIERVVEGRAPAKVMAEHRARYAFAARFVRQRRVLDVACGSGYGSRMLHQAGAAGVVGVDRDEEAVAFAQRRYGNDAVTFRAGDACAPPVRKPFDVIVSFETIEHLDDPVAFLTTCRELLAPGGLFLVSTPYRHRVRTDGKPVNPFHVREWRTEEFERLLRDFFLRVTLFGQALKLRKRRFLPLSRRWAMPLARLQGRRPGAPDDLYRLPGPRLLGLWWSFPGYLLAVCQRPAR